MCMSRLHLVTSRPRAGQVRAVDLDGRSHAVSLLAFDGEPPQPGDWVVVHSGFALGPALAEDVAAASLEWASVAAGEGAPAEHAWTGEQKERT